MSPSRRCTARSVAALLVLVFISATVSAAPALAASAGTATLAPLPESSYSVAPACSAPTAGDASCFALELRGRTAAARAHTHPIGITRHFASAAAAADACDPAKASAGCFGLRPQDLRDAYFNGESAEAPEPQTIALVDAYNDYEAEKELEVFDEEFGLPSLPTCVTSGDTDCFERVNANGERATAELPFPKEKAELEEAEDRCVTPRAKETAKEHESNCDRSLAADGWGIEMATDIEVARGVCENCKILLVEASSAEFSALEQAEDTAAQLGATEISNSWGGAPPSSGDSSAFNHRGVVVTAASGDDGYRNWKDAAKTEAERSECREAGGSLSECDEIGYYSAGADFPASSPDVVAVGGTKLTLEDGARKDETVWNGRSSSEGAGGGGCSTSFVAPLWQQTVSDWPEVGCGSLRAVADISADADPNTGVAIYDSMPDLRAEEGEDGEMEVVSSPLYWWPIGGTSVASPIIASLYALAGGAEEAEYPARTLYSHLRESSLYDVTSGGNGECDDDYAGCSGSLSSAFDCGEGELICNATSGYDGPTGVGAPDGLAAFERSTIAEEKLHEAELGVPAREQQLAEEKREAEREQREREEAKRREEVEREVVERQEAKTLEEAHEREQAQREAIAEEHLKALDRLLELEQALRRAEESSRKTSSESGKEAGSKPALLSLALTKAAAKALTHRGARVGEVAFSFDLSAAAKVQAKLELQTKVHGNERWRVVAHGSIGFSAASGVATRSFKSHQTLAAGRYRIVLTPHSGSSRALVFSVR